MSAQHQVGTGVASACLAMVASVAIPEETLSYGVKLLLALPLGLLTGLGTGLAAWLVRKLTAQGKKE